MLLKSTCPLNTFPKSPKSPKLPTSCPAGVLVVLVVSVNNVPLSTNNDPAPSSLDGSSSFCVNFESSNKASTVIISSLSNFKISSNSNVNNSLNLY